MKFLLYFQACNACSLAVNKKFCDIQGFLGEKHDQELSGKRTFLHVRNLLPSQPTKARTSVYRMVLWSVFYILQSLYGSVTLHYDKAVWWGADKNRKHPNLYEYGAVVQPTRYLRLSLIESVTLSLQKYGTSHIQSWFTSGCKINVEIILRLSLAFTFSSYRSPKRENFHK